MTSTLKNRINEQGEQIFFVNYIKNVNRGHIICLLHEKVHAERAKSPKIINEHALLLDT